MQHVEPGSVLQCSSKTNNYIGQSCVTSSTNVQLQMNTSTAVHLSFNWGHFRDDFPSQPLA